MCVLVILRENSQKWSDAKVLIYPKLSERGISRYVLQCSIRLNIHRPEHCFSYCFFMIFNVEQQNVQLTLKPLCQGCQTRFSSRATSGICNLKRAGPAGEIIA